MLNEFRRFSDIPMRHIYLTKGVETLVDLLNSEDGRLKRLASKNVVDFIIRHKETEDLDKPLAEIEKLLAERQTR